MLPDITPCKCEVEVGGSSKDRLSLVDEDGGAKRDVLTALVEHLIAAGVYRLTPLAL